MTISYSSKNYHAHLVARLYSFQEDNRYTDVCIKIDGKEFHAHRVLLAASTRYFESMFDGNYIESKRTTVPLHNLPAYSFETILSYIYTGNSIWMIHIFE